MDLPLGEFKVEVEEYAVRWLVDAGRSSLDD
jgi:hypothetical protein